MKYSERLGNNAVVPVVVLDEVYNAIPTAKALLAGGIDVMEITLRTAAAMDSIKVVSEQCSEMLVGAGTVVNVDQAKAVVEARGVVHGEVSHQHTFPLEAVLPTADD